MWAVFIPSDLSKPCHPQVIDDNHKLRDLSHIIGCTTVEVVRFKPPARWPRHNLITDEEGLFTHTPWRLNLRAMAVANLEHILIGNAVVVGNDGPEWTCLGQGTAHKMTDALNFLPGQTVMDAWRPFHDVGADDPTRGEHPRYTARNTMAAMTALLHLSLNWAFDNDQRDRAFQHLIDAKLIPACLSGQIDPFGVGPTD